MAKTYLSSLTLSLLTLLLSAQVYAEGDYQLTITEVSVAPKNPDGKPWDLAMGKGKMPDLFASVAVNGAYVLQQSFAKDSLTVTPGAQSKSFNFDDQALVNVIVYDKDMSEDDLIGSIHFKVTPNDLGKTLTHQQGFVKSVKVKLTLTRAGEEARARKRAEAEAKAAKQAAESAEARAVAEAEAKRKAESEAEAAKQAAESAEAKAATEADKARKAREAKERIEKGIQKVKEAQMELNKAIKETESER